MKFSSPAIFAPLRVAAFCLAFAGASALGNPAHAIEVCDSGPRHTCVVDGDTLWLDGVKYRLAGYDTPEPSLRHACGGQTEVALGYQATFRLLELLNTADWYIEPIGGEDQYGRVLANISVNGEDAGDILIREGLARSWPDGAEFWCS